MIVKLLVWAIALALAFAALSWFARRSVFYPMKYPGGWWGVQEELGAKDVWLQSADGTKLHGWMVEQPGAQFVTLFLHGNAGNLTHRVRSIHPIRQAGSNVLVIDYRGYGKSEGSPSESGLYADAQAAYNHLIGQSYKPEQIVLHGESLGTAVAVELATRNPIGGLILEAPFSSAGAVASGMVPVLGAMLISGFDSKTRISGVHAPLLVIHGDRDEVIPYRLGQDLFASANEPKKFRTIASAHHNDIVETAGPAYADMLREFYQSLGNK